MVNDDTRPSKTQQKKHMLALQDLGAELVALNEEQLASMTLPDSLREAVAAAKRITRFEARRRQLQYIGKLMRTIDAEPIRARLEAWKSSSREHSAQLHRIERWRERLLAEEGALAEFIGNHSHADAQQLRALLRNTQRERTANKPPRSYRALFQFIRATFEQNAEDTVTHDPEQR
ncbi:MAG TPA: ribosome biogenesis factor YjgA [Burkholderiales bacterium]|jgi:ribosome-associated protein|nr:ribosome biogenesis factor YjgA [Burkholderiales bacterium]